jgi:hypothetical protein
MPSNYPNGFLHGVTIRGVPILQCNPGQVFWVNNSSVLADGAVAGSDGNSGDYRHPFATIDYAIGRCTAGRGDIICIMPGHAEAVASAGAIAMDVAGVTLVGLGRGTARPTLNFTATAATMTFSAANTSMVNVLLTGGIDAVVSPLVVSASDVYIELNYRDVTGQCTNCLLTTAGANRLKVHVNEYDGATAAGTDAGIAIVGGSNIEITGRYMDGNFAVGGIDVRTTATTNLFVHDFQYFRTRNAADIFIIDTITASTGQIGPNINLRLNDNAANVTEAITGATFVVMDPVYVVNNANEKGLLINWTATADA